MEGKEKIPDYLSLYKDLTSKIIDTMLPNLNLNPAYNLGQNNAQQVFSQYEVAYVVENLRGLDEKTAWHRIPSIIKNLKTYNYAKINIIQNPIVLEDLLKKVNIAVEINSEEAGKINNLNEIVKTVLLITAVLKKIDESHTPKVIIVNEEARSVVKSTELDKSNDCNEEYESLDEDFKVEERAFSQSMADFLISRDSKKEQKNKRKRKLHSIDAALQKIINVVETSMDNAKNISDNMAVVKVVDPAAVLKKVQELKDKLAEVKLKCDEFVAKFLDDELMKRIHEDAVNRDEDVDKPDSKSVADEEVVILDSKTDKILPLEIELVLKGESSIEAVSKEECSKEIGSQQECSKETVSQKAVEMLPHEIETVSKAECSNSDIKSPSNLKSLNTTDEIDGSADQTFVIEDRIQPIETTSESNKPAFKLKSGGFLKIKPLDSKSSVESICSDMSSGDCDLSRIINKALRRKINRIHTFIESDSGTNTVFCKPCNVEFTVTHLNMSEHIYTSQHLDSLGTYYFDAQEKLLETYPNILKTLELPYNALWNDRIFIDPSTKIAFCVSCRTALQYTVKAIRNHIKSKAHIAEVLCMKEQTRKINIHDERISAFLRGNRIMNVPFDGETLSCIPCDMELTTELCDVVRHTESAKHQNTLDEYNYKVQKEIIKSNQDLFGFGKQYPLTEKHLRQDKLFVNPVADFAYCGICRKPVNLNDIQHNFLTHLTIEEHAVNFELSRQFRDTFEEVVQEARPKLDAAMLCNTPIVNIKTCDKPKTVTSKPVSLKRRYDESDSISQENLPSDLWYIPLEQWIQKENNDDASKQSVATLTNIIKVKGSAFTDMQMTAPKTAKISSSLPVANNPEEKDNLKQQISTAVKKEKQINRHIRKLSIINRLVKRKPDLKLCDPCKFLFPNDLNIITQHIRGIKHIVKLCQFNAKLQREMITRFPLVFAPSSPFSMTDTLIDRDTIFIDPVRHLIFCGCCTVQLKYKKRDIKAHVYSQDHAIRRSIYLAELKTMTPAKDGTDKLPETSSYFDKRKSESSSLDIEESIDDNEESKYSTDVNSDEISRCSSMNEMNPAWIDKEKPPLEENSAANSSHPKEDTENGNKKQHLVTKSCIASDDNRKQCTNSDSNPNNEANNAAPIVRYGMDSRLLNGRIDQDYTHIHIYIIKTGNNYRCVDCDYNDIVSIPMAFAHLRSCFHNPVVVEGVQYLKEANYHCIVCKMKIYGIKDVVDHILHIKHVEKLKKYYR